MQQYHAYLHTPDDDEDLGVFTRKDRAQWEADYAERIAREVYGCYARHEINARVIEERV